MVIAARPLPWPIWLPTAPPRTPPATAPRPVPWPFCCTGRTASITPQLAQAATRCVLPSWLTGPCSLGCADAVWVSWRGAVFCGTGLATGAAGWAGAVAATVVVAGAFSVTGAVLDTAAGDGDGAADGSLAGARSIKPAARPKPARARPPPASRALRDRREPLVGTVFSSDIVKLLLDCLRR